MSDWPKKAFYWIENRILYVSIPFTWELPKVRQCLQQRSMFWDRAFVGGPAVELMPDYFANFDFVSIGHEMPGMLEADRTITNGLMPDVRRAEPCLIRFLGLAQPALWPTNMTESLSG